MINYISPEIITRNLLFIRAKITDITYIKFEFVCQLCKGGTLLSSARCINNCTLPRPLMRISMRVIITDDQHGQGSLSLTDHAACRAFGIDLSNIDIFKTYFFLHGVFFYRSLSQKSSQEYMQVIEFFKTSQSRRHLAFLVTPFCKLENTTDLCTSNENRAKMLKQIASGKTDQHQVQQIYVNGEVREITDERGKSRLGCLVCFRAVRVWDERKERAGGEMEIGADQQRKVN